jgi:hypothetical protein
MLVLAPLVALCSVQTEIHPLIPSGVIPLARVGVLLVFTAASMLNR